MASDIGEGGKKINYIRKYTPLLIYIYFLIKKQLNVY